MSAEGYLLTCGIVYSDVETVANYYKLHRLPIWWGQRNIECRNMQGDYERLCSLLGPVNVPFASKVAVIQTQIEGVCIVFENSRFGTDAGTLREISSELKIPVIRIVESGVNQGNRQTSSYSKAAIWHYIDKNKNISRSISVYKDAHGWSFEQFGELMPYENYNNYEAKLKSSRMNGKIIAEYLRNLEIPVIDQDMMPTLHEMNWVRISAH